MGKSNSAELNLGRRRAKVYIHINKHRMHANRKSAEKVPVIAVRVGRSGKPQYCNDVSGPGFRVTYDPDNPLCIGAESWVEVDVNVPLTISGTEEVRTQGGVQCVA